MKREIRELAARAGYDLIGFTAPRLSEEDVGNLNEFGRENERGPIGWFNRHLDIRTDPRLIFPGVRSVLMLGTIYRNRDYGRIFNARRLKISRYATGVDYHRFLRKRGKRLLSEITGRFAHTRGRITVDSAPVPEKILGREAGLGWQGKNTNLIHPREGSYFFLSALFMNLEIEPDAPIRPRCGRCRLCIDACPTGALSPYRIDARRCTSALTIESPEPIPEEFRNRLEGWVFGCDICQEICPYNKDVQLKGVRQVRSETRCAEFRPREELLELLDGEEDGPIEWERLTRGSPLRRIDPEKFRDNVRAAGGSEAEGSNR